MKYEEHCQECTLKLGKPFGEVHRWLDAYAGTRQYGMRHRRKRHHQAGLREVRHLFGEAAVEAARLHILSDLKEEGWKEDDPFPRDENHYVKMGLY